MMKQIYYEKDKKRGIPKTFCWLIEEIGELAKSINKKNLDFGPEFADVFAWLCSLANLLEIDLEKVALDKYDYRCYRCLNNPCKCKD